MTKTLSQFLHLSTTIIFFIFSVNCSVYESDARKFLREEGLEYRDRSLELSLNSTADQHCFDQKDLKQNNKSYVEKDKLLIQQQAYFARATYESDFAEDKPSFYCQFESAGKKFNDPEINLMISLIEEFKISYQQN